MQTRNRWKLDGIKRIVKNETTSTSNRTCKGKVGRVGKSVVVCKALHQLLGEPCPSRGSMSSVPISGRPSGTPSVFDRAGFLCLHRMPIRRAQDSVVDAGSTGPCELLASFVEPLVRHPLWARQDWACGVPGQHVSLPAPVKVVPESRCTLLRPEG